MRVFNAVKGVGIVVLLVLPILVDEPPLAPTPPTDAMEEVDRERYVDHIHTMAELVWRDFCREDER